jgi:hypothetical protein
LLPKAPAQDRSQTPPSLSQERQEPEPIPSLHDSWARGGSRDGGEVIQNFQRLSQKRKGLILKSSLKPIANS